MRTNHILSLFILYIICGHACGQNDYRITHYDEDDGLMEAEVFQGHQDTDGLIWFASRDGLIRYDSHRFTTFKAYPGDDCPLRSNHISRFEDRGNHIICMSQDKAYTFDKNTGRFTPSHSMPRKLDPNNMYDKMTERIKSLPEYQGMDNLKVRLIDQQGGIWVRSSRGLERIEKTVRKPAPVMTGSELEEEVRALMIDSRGNRWVADKNRHIRIFAPEGGVRYLMPDGSVSATRQPFGMKAYCMHEDRKGRIWIGCKPDGLVLLTRKGTGFNVRHFKAAETPYALNSNAIYDIAEDKKGRIWIATYGGGLNMADERGDGTVRFLNKTNKLRAYPANAMFIHGMAIRHDGILVAATSEGLVTARVAGDAAQMTFVMNKRRPNDATSLPTDYLHDVIETKDKKTVISTNGGGICSTPAQGSNLLREDIAFETYNSQGSTTTDVFLSLTEDHNGNVWAVGKTSLTKINTGNGKIENYNKMSFGGSFMFSEAMPICDRHGIMTLGTTQGYLTLDTKGMGKSTFVPNIKIYAPDTIRLTSEEKSVIVDFSAIDYSQHEPITYAYMIDGLDREWQYTHDNHIYYGNIPRGTYKLRVRSTNSDGVWTDNEKSITIIRKPAFNETRTAWMLYGILLLISAAAIYHTARYIHKLRKEMRDYQLKASEQIEYMANRVRELTAGHSEIHSSEDNTDENTDEDFTAKAKAYVRENIGDSSITVETFAQHMNMSKSLLYLKCKKHLGHTPNSFIQNTRINYAAQMLKKSKEAPNISDIAYKCGFADPKYFSRCFKKSTGLTPSAYAAQEEE